MNRKIRLLLQVLIAVGLFAVMNPGVGGWSAKKKSDHSSGISRSMEQAIRLYEAGEDNAAMDRFMDILMKGSPSEKALANEYVSKITLRMNAGGLNYPGTKTEGDPTLRNIASGQERGEPARQRETYESSKVPLGERAPSSSAASPASRKLAEKKIREKIAEMRSDILLRLNDAKKVKIYKEGEDLLAVSVDPKVLFAKETAFREKAPEILADMAGLLFTMGKHHCLILPEGSVTGNIKIMNIRRALAVNSYLTERGISPARLDVNLIGSDVNLPSSLRDIKGMVFLFNKDFTPNLQPPDKSEKEKAQISMGIYPTTVNPHKNEGAVIELAVYETPFADPTWKFQIFQIRDNKTMFLIQELSGTGAVYRQSFWNAKKDFFGEAYPPGQYVFALRAANAQGIESVVRKLLLVKSRSGRVPEPKVESKVLKKSGFISNSMKGKYKNQGVKYPPEEFYAGAGSKAEKKPSAGEKTAGPAAPPADREDSSLHVSYKIYFKSGARSITDTSEQKLLQVADNMNFYPMSKISVIGYAYSGEPNSEALAQNRVNFVVSRLSTKYGIEKSRMNLKSEISEVPVNMVEIKMVGSD